MGKDKVQGICDTFAQVLVANNTTALMKMMTTDCEWNLMASGEQFIGIVKVKEMAERSIASRKHISGSQIALSNKFAGEDQFCIQYVHRAVVTDQWPSSLERLALGTMVAINICIVCHVHKDGKVARTDEYFDLGQLLLWGIERELYS
jgi:hypothetical protein